MPKKPAISQAHLASELKKRQDIFNEDGALNGKTCKIWEDIQKSLQLSLQPQSLYLLVYKNKPLINELRSHFKINYIEKQKSSLDLDPTYMPSGELRNPYNCETLEFDIQLSSTDIIECFTSSKIKSEWRNKVRDEIWNVKFLPCPFSLNGWLTNESFIFNGTCSDCGTGIVGKSAKEENILTVHVKTFDTRDIVHSKKLRLQGSRRQEVKKHLHHQTASNYRQSELEKITTKYEPPQLNTTLTLRKAREEGLDELIGFKEYKALSITNKKFLNQCGVRKLSVNPFYIIYFSDDQLKFWNAIQEEMLPLSFDATGSVVKKYMFYPSIKSKTLFYYAMVVGIGGKIIPLMQAILSIHHVSVIQEVLDRWLHSGAKVPKEITTDGSLALQNSICLSFNKMTFKQYNNKCFEVLICNEKINELPISYLRHDVAHLLKAAAEWKCLKVVNPVVRDFYLRAIGYLTQCDTIAKFVDVVTCIIIIASSPLAKEGSKAYLSLEKLLNLFKTYEHKIKELISAIENNNKADSEQAYINIQTESNNTNCIELFINNLFTEILLDCTNDDMVSEKVNFYYCPEFNKLFKGLCHTFPTWTNCMKPLFNSPNEVGTSTRSETNFKDLKLNIPHPLKLQKFILKDCKRNKAKVKVGMMKLKEEKQIKPNSGSLFNLNFDNLITSVVDRYQKHCKDKLEKNLNLLEPEIQEAPNSSICNFSITNILKTSSPILKQN